MVAGRIEKVRLYLVLSQFFCYGGVLPTRAGDQQAICPRRSFEPARRRFHVATVPSSSVLSPHALPGYPAVNKLWNIADLIDLHFLFQADEELRRREGEAALAKRDRIIYVAKIEPQLGKMDDIPPRILVRKWLAMRRLQYRQERGHEGQVLPGTLWQEMALLCRGLVFCCGLLAGAGLAGSLLVYAGTMPLNVAVYFGLFVVLQLVMIGLQGGCSSTGACAGCPWSRPPFTRSSAGC
jgi:hypothetical protein